MLFVAHYHQPVRSTVAPIARALRVQGVDSRLVVEDGDDAMRDAAIESDIDIVSLPAPSTTSRRPATFLRECLICSDHVRERLDAMSECLRATRPAGIVLLDDRTLLAWRWTFAAKRLNIPVITVQWALLDPRDVMRMRRASHRDGQDRHSIASASRNAFERMVDVTMPGMRDGDEHYIPTPMALAHMWCGAVPAGDLWCFGAGSSDRVCVFSEEDRRAAITGGGTPDRIVVTGHPDHDRWHAYRPSNGHRPTSDDANRPLITVISSALALRRKGDPRDDRHDLIESFRSAINAVHRAWPGANVLFRPHPRDRDDDPMRWLPSGVIIDSGHDDVERRIAGSDLVVGQWSTALGAAAALGIPLILFDFHARPHRQIWPASAPMNWATTPEEVAAQVDGVRFGRAATATEERRRSFTASIRFDGRATSRIVDVLLDAIGTSPVSMRELAIEEVAA